MNANAASLDLKILKCKSESQSIKNIRSLNPNPSTLIQVSLGSYCISPVPTLNECNNLSDILLIKQAVDAALDPSFLDLNHSLDYYKMGPEALNELRHLSMEAVIERLKRKLEQGVQKNNNDLADATAVDYNNDNENVSEPISLSIPNNNITPSKNIEANQTRQTTPFFGNYDSSNNKTNDSGKVHQGKTIESCRKSAYPVALAKPLSDNPASTHSEAKSQSNEHVFEKDVNGHIEVENEVEEMTVENGDAVADDVSGIAASLDDTEVLTEQEDLQEEGDEEVEATAHKLYHTPKQNEVLLSPCRQAPFKGVSRDEENANTNAASVSFWKTSLTINSKNLLDSDHQKSKYTSTTFDLVSLSISGCSDPIEAALLFDLTSCWRARRRGVDIPTSNNFYIEDIQCHPVAGAVLQHILGPKCAYAEQLIAYMQSLIDEKTLLKILDVEARAAALEKYSEIADTTTPMDEIPVSFGGTERKEKSTKGNEKATEKEEAIEGNEVIYLVSDDEGEAAAATAEKDQAPIAALAAAPKMNEKKKKRKINTNGAEMPKLRTLFTARKTADVSKRTKPARTPTPCAGSACPSACLPPPPPPSLDGQAQQNDDTGDDETTLSEMYSLLLSPKFEKMLDETEVVRFIEKFSSITNISEMKRWQLKILQGVASEGKGNSVGKFIKRALITPLSDE
jgi:hypothetical protein